MFVYLSHDTTGQGRHMTLHSQGRDSSARYEDYFLPPITKPIAESIFQVEKIIKLSLLYSFLCYLDYFAYLIRVSCVYSGAMISHIENQIII